MKNERLHFLFQLYLSQKCSTSQETELMQLMAEPSNDEDREKLIIECFDNLPETYVLSEADAERVFNEIIEKPVRKTIPFFLKQPKMLRWVSLAAAMAIIFISVTVLLLRNNKPVNDINQVVEIAKTTITQKPLYKNDIKPGGNKAILTLSDGSKILLDDASQGTISQQGNTTVVKLDAGRLAYNTQTTTPKQSKEILYNTLTTPLGGQYCITLPDGTIVWLNASTSLRFPTAFTGNVRKVEIKGEAYFEVANNKELPFIVMAGNSEVKVLGTHFNVMAYAEDKVMKTTLLEGSVEVSVVKQAISESKGSVITLQPGQQAQLDMNNEFTVVEADITEAVAWKNGLFTFNDEDIESIMQKISRWYDIKVVYNLKTEDKRFTGSISRRGNVSEVLRMLEATESVHFKIEGKTVSVLP